MCFLREKWTVFEEATRVPLIIAHPQSPFKGQHYKYPTESVDIYATLNELLKPTVTRNEACQRTGLKCKPLQGKSLSPIILGKEIYEQNFGKTPVGLLSSLKSMLLGHQSSHSTALTTTTTTSNTAAIMPALEHNFALTQIIRCIPQDALATSTKPGSNSNGGNGNGKIARQGRWQDCDIANKKETLFATLGYSMRTPEYRYTAYFIFNRTTQLPEIDIAPYEEELYDHKNETLADFTHRETFNLAIRPVYTSLITNLRNKLVAFIKNSIVFGDH